MKSIYDYESSGDEGNEPGIETFAKDTKEGRKEIIDCIMKK